jgi:hypothetical protein
MAFRDLLRSDGKGPKLYRRPWSETDNPLVAEARAQTRAIQQLQLWLRLAYSALALAALLGYWGFTDGKSIPAGIAGVVLGVFSLAVVIILRTGIANGRRNVEAMLETLRPDKEQKTQEDTPSA